MIQLPDVPSPPNPMDPEHVLQNCPVVLVTAGSARFVAWLTGHDHQEACFMQTVVPDPDSVGYQYPGTPMVFGRDRIQGIEVLKPARGR